MKIELPYDYGDVVYHKTKSERVKGMVVGYTLRPSNFMVIVIWEENLEEIAHYPVELTREFEPTYPAKEDE